MEPILLIHGYSAESPDPSDDGIRAAYEAWVARVRKAVGEQVEIVELDLARYISLDDTVSVDDIAVVMDRVLREQYSHLLTSRFNVMTHSTGALVVRNYLRRFWDPQQPCPIVRVIHLAGANLGSGWAHIGKTQLARWFRSFFGVQPGQKVLNALELASSWTVDMHMELDRKWEAADPDNRPLEFALIGSQPPDIFIPVPVRYGKEDGSDSVVRVSATNPNYIYVRVEPTELARELSSSYAQSIAKDAIARGPDGISQAGAEDPYYEFVQSSVWKPGLNKIQKPFAVIFQCSHTGKGTSIVDGETTDTQVVALLKTALETTQDSYADAVVKFDNATAETLSYVRKMPDGHITFIPIHRKPQYDGFAQVVLRVWDQDGNPVDHFNVHFNSFGGDRAPGRLINELIEDVHGNEITSNTIAFYMRVLAWDNEKQDWVDRLSEVQGFDLEIDAIEPGSERVSFLPTRLPIRAANLGEWVVPNQTTIIDVTLMRVPSDDVFRIVGAK